MCCLWSKDNSQLTAPKFLQPSLCLEELCCFFSCFFLISARFVFNKGIVCILTTCQHWNQTIGFEIGDRIPMTSTVKIQKEVGKLPICSWFEKFKTLAQSHRRNKPSRRRGLQPTFSHDLDGQLSREPSARVLPLALPTSQVSYPRPFLETIRGFVPPTLRHLQFAHLLRALQIRM